MNTPRAQSRRQRQFAAQAAYSPFPALPEGLSELDCVRLHLRWLLTNMDWFAQRGARELQTASLAVQRDMAILGCGPQAAAIAAAAPQPEPAGPDEQSLQVVVKQQSEFIESLKSRLGWAKAFGRHIEKQFMEFAPPEAERHQWAQKNYDEIWRLLNEIFKL